MFDVFKKILLRNVSESEVKRNENFKHYAHVVPVTTYLNVNLMFIGPCIIVIVEE